MTEPRPPRTADSPQQVRPSFGKIMRARLALGFESARKLPALLGRVVPELTLSRLRETESLVHVIRMQAARRPKAPALLLADSRLDYAELLRGLEQRAAYLEGEGVRRGSVVALVGDNSIEYVLLLLACARLGAPVALVGPELEGELLERALSRAGAAFVLSDAGRAPRVRRATPRPVLSYGDDSFLRLVARAPQTPSVALPPGGDADFAYVYTSGTTGNSKPCRVSHRRALSAATIFSRLVHGLRSDDVLYCALPLCHASALLLGLGATLVGGGALALRERFSASALLSDLRQHRATLLLYVGELGRAWLAQPQSAHDREHRLRLAIGNGMSPEVWSRLQARFAIPKIVEFYAATEFPGAVVNLTGEVGSVGQLPFARLRGYRLARVDADTGELARTAQGRAIPCGVDEPGELLYRLKPAVNRPTGNYLGYVGERPGGERIARDVFRAGDVWCRSGDLLRMDATGAYFFVDRLGDTFRFKGENVSTREVEGVLRDTPSVTNLAVVGVALPGVEGKLGLAIVDAPEGVSLEALAERARRLPSFARPCFVRLTRELSYTASLKVKKAQFAREGVDPGEVSDEIYFRQGERYVRLGGEEYRRILEGEVRF
jgi:fatty-acyl-CoA synthase